MSTASARGRPVADMEFCCDLCARLRVPFLCERADVPAARLPGEGLEAAARRLRYAFLRRAKEAAGASCIAHRPSRRRSGRDGAHAPAARCGPDGSGGHARARGRSLAAAAAREKTGSGFLFARARTGVARGCHQRHCRHAAQRPCASISFRASRPSIPARHWRSAALPNRRPWRMIFSKKRLRAGRAAALNCLAAPSGRSLRRPRRRSCAAFSASSSARGRHGSASAR